VALGAAAIGQALPGMAELGSPMERASQDALYLNCGR